MIVVPADVVYLRCNKVVCLKMREQLNEVKGLKYRPCARWVSSTLKVRR